MLNHHHPWGIWLPVLLAAMIFESAGTARAQTTGPLITMGDCYARATHPLSGDTIQTAVSGGPATWGRIKALYVDSGR